MSEVHYFDLLPPVVNVHSDPFKVQAVKAVELAELVRRQPESRFIENESIGEVDTGEEPLRFKGRGLIGRKSLGGIIL